MQFDSIFPFFTNREVFLRRRLLLIMNSLHAMAKVPYGWAIVLITVVLRLAFWPLTAKSTQSAKKMQTLQPPGEGHSGEVKEHDSMKAQKKVMELYKENKVNPMGGCHCQRWCSRGRCSWDFTRCCVARSNCARRISCG